MLASIKKSFQNSVFPWIIVWILYMGLYSMIKPHVVLAEWFGFVAINGLNVFLISLSFILWRQAERGSLAKRIFLFFILAYCFVLIDSCIYYVMYNILHIPHAQAPFFWVSVDNMAYTVFLLFKFLAWTSILFAVKAETTKTMRVYLPVIFMFCAIFFVSVYATNWNMGMVSFRMVYDFTEKILQAGCFIAIAFCLVAAKNRGLFYLAIGASIGTISCNIMDFGLFSQSYGMGSILESSWILSWLLMVYGFIELGKSKTLNNVHTWIAAPNSIRAQVAYWSFVVLMIFLVVAFVTLKLTAPTVFF